MRDGQSRDNVRKATSELIAVPIGPHPSLRAATLASRVSGLQRLIEIGIQILDILNSG